MLFRSIRSGVTINSGSIDFNDDTCLIATDSPVVVNLGSVAFSDTSLLNLTTSVSTLEINDGDFELQDSTEFFIAPLSTIDVFAGNFLVTDFVQVDLNQVDTFVGGNALFADQTRLHMSNADLTVDGGNFDTNTDADIQFRDGQVSVFGGSFTTADNVNMEFHTTPLAVEGNVIFNGTINSNHYFEDSPITVQGAPVEGLLQANEFVCITAIRSEIGRAHV